MKKKESCETISTEISMWSFNMDVLFALIFHLNLCNVSFFYSFHLPQPVQNVIHKRKLSRFFVGLPFIHSTIKKQFCENEAFETSDSEMETTKNKTDDLVTVLNVFIRKING
jgi:hypothetical protein